MRKKHYTERTVLNTKRTPLITKCNQRLKGEHCPFTELPDGTYAHNTHDSTHSNESSRYTLPEENVPFLSPLVWTLPFHKLPWTGQAGTRGEIHQMQTSWLSPSTEKEMMKEISDFIYFPSYSFCQDCCLGQETICCGPGDPGDFFFIYTSQLMGLASVHHHFKSQPLCSSVYI